MIIEIEKLTIAIHTITILIVLSTLYSSEGSFWAFSVSFSGLSEKPNFSADVMIAT